MSDQNTNQPPALAVQIIAGLARHLLTAVAATLGTAGALSSDQETQFVGIGVGLIVFAGSAAWSAIQKRNAKR